MVQCGSGGQDTSYRASARALLGQGAGSSTHERSQTEKEKAERKVDMAGGKTDELKGRVKEAAGALTGDAKLKQEGQLDQTVGKIKQTTEKMIDKVKKAVK
jgi:uncharacterized protein YjbJ (UPF0337 family)